MMALVPDDDFAAMRQAMIVSQLRPNGVTDSRLLDAMAAVAREQFLPEARRASAYVDRAIDFGDGRAINPPLTTALLLNAAAIGPADRVLIVAQAPAYVAAVAAMLTEHLTIWNADEPLPSDRQFDAIVIDGAVEIVPDGLVEVLAGNGRLTCAIVDHGVTRLCVGRKGGAGFALADFTDAQAVRMPEFAKPRAFVF